MIEFPPNIAFESLYYKQLVACERRLERKGLTDQIRNAFVHIAKQSIESTVDPRSQHLVRLQGWKPVPGMKSISSCSVCLVRIGIFAMDCAHLLCAFCVSFCYPAVSPCHYMPLLCLLCQEPNDTMFILNPPTAKVRKLNLGGLQPANVWRFLKEVQQVAGLKQAGISLQHLFDTVEASEIGNHYSLTILRIEIELVLSAERNILRFDLIYRRLELRGLQAPFTEFKGLQAYQISCNIRTRPFMEFASILAI